MKLQNKTVSTLNKTLSQSPLSEYFFPFFSVRYFSLYDENTDTWLLGFSHALPKELKVLQSKVEVCIKI